MRNPKSAQSAKAKKRDEASKGTPSLESPIVEETSNGEQPSQPPVMKELATEPETAAPNSERVSALAVVSVVSSLFGFLGITSLLGLGLGIVALRQMATNPQLSGRHLAILGVCLSVFWLVLLLAMGSVLWVGMSLLKTLFNAIF